VADRLSWDSGQPDNAGSGENLLQMNHRIAFQDVATVTTAKLPMTVMLRFDLAALAGAVLCPLSPR
jgi:hypothetical protein